MWDLSRAARARERSARSIAQAIGPVWEANHVWLIFVVVALFAAFPPAFAALGVALYVPFTHRARWGSCSAARRSCSARTATAGRVAATLDAACSASRRS